MAQNTGAKPNLFSIPVNPTPSLKAYIEFLERINKYLGMFNYDSSGLSRDIIRLGTEDNPNLIAPIELPPRAIEDILRPALIILKEALMAAQESIRWTREILEMIGPESPEAEQRIETTGRIMEEIQEILNECRDHAWHPRCYFRIRELSQYLFRPGNPGIPIQITIII